jgi:hypothetical protein
MYRACSHASNVPIAAEKYHFPLCILYDHVKERVTKIVPTIFRKGNRNYTLGAAVDGIGLTKEQFNLLALLPVIFLQGVPIHSAVGWVSGKDWWSAL